MSPPDGTTTTTTGTDDAGAAAAAAAAAGTTGTTTTTNGNGAATGTNGTATTGTEGTTTTTTSGNATGTMATGDNAPVWRDDWRKHMAKGDADAIKRLERYASPEAVAEALVNAQKKIDSGMARPTLPDNATPEQITEYRKANGIPETPDKYDLTLSKGLVVGEADKPLVDSFLKHMHGQHATPAEVKRGLEWYYGQQDALRQDQETKDATFKNDSIAKLGEKYGGEYKRNIAHVDAYLEEFPPGVKDKVLGARLPNGRLAGSDPEFIDFLFQQALFKNPIATVMGGNSEANVKAAETRMEELRKMSGDDKSPYWAKNAAGQALRDEYLRLIEGTEKIKAAKR